MKCQSPKDGLAFISVNAEIGKHLRAVQTRQLHLDSLYIWTKLDPIQKTQFSNI